MPWLGVAAIRPAAESIRPHGIHLRWLYAPTLGYPNKGFDVFRLETDKLKWACQPVASNASAGNLASGFDAGPFRLHYDDSRGPLEAFGANGARQLSIPLSQLGRELVIQFDTPVLGCRVTFMGPRDRLQLRAFSGGKTVAQVEAPQAGDTMRTLTVVGSNITSVRTSLNARQITEVCHIASRGIDWGHALVHLDAPSSQNEALGRLEPGLRNRFATSAADAARKYAGPAKDLVETFAGLFDPGAQFVDPAQPQAQLVLSPPGNTPLGGYKPHQFILLGSLDPNVARMAGLYWVDRAAQADQSYSYRIIGTWSGGGVTADGYALDIGAKPGFLPSLGSDARVEGDMVPGRRWRNRDPLSRVALRWSAPDRSITNPAVQAVAYDVDRLHGARSERLTEKSVALVPGSTFAKKAACFTDDAAPLGQLRYSVRPIDVFGQVGEPVPSNEVRVADLEAPPPPVRVTTQIEQAGLPWRNAADRALADGRALVHVNYEFGAAQLRQAPDAHAARLYWRPDAPFDQLEGNFSMVSSSFIAGQKRRRSTLAIDTNGLFDPARFKGGVIRIGLGGAIAKRHAFAIVDAAMPDRIIVDSDADLTLEPGPCVLRTDPYRRDLWQRIGPDVPLQDAWNLQNLSNLGDDDASLSLTARLTAVNVEGDAAAVSVDLQLFESGVLDGATITSGGTTRNIASSRSGADALLQLDGDLAATAGHDVTLILPATGQQRFASVAGGTPAQLGFNGPEPGGELTFEIGGNLIVTRVLGAHSTNGGQHLLLRLPGDTRPGAGTGARFRRAYRVDFRASLVAGTAGDVDLPVTAGTRSGHIALTCVDVRGNEGPLSAAVPFTAVRPPPTAIPTPPFPRGNSGAARGYATPPDARGLATLWLEWQPIPGLRYEVGRALDQSVLATDRQGWLTAAREPGLGSWPIEIVDAQATPDGVTAQFALPAGVTDAQLVVPSVQQGDSLWTAARVADDVFVLTGDGIPSTGAAVLLAAPVRLWRSQTVRLSDVAGQVVADVTPYGLDGARLDIGGHRYTVTVARGHALGGSTLRLRPISKNAPPLPSGAASLHRAPDYSRVSGAEVLRALAGKSGNEDAFALVTGTPITQHTFLDELPGRGSNHFFYRVRGVDPAGNVTPWSPVSIPIRLVDTTPPAVSSDLAATPGERKVTLTWRHDAAGWPMTYRVLRRGGADLAAPEVLVATIDGTGGTQHTYTDHPVAGLRADETYAYRIESIKHVACGIGPDIDVTTVSASVRVRAFDTTPPVPPSDLTATRTSPSSIRVSWSTSEPMAWLLKRKDPSGPTCVVVPHGSATAGALVDNHWSYIYDDRTVSSATGWQYELAVTSRINLRSELVTVVEAP